MKKVDTFHLQENNSTLNWTVAMETMGGDYLMAEVDAYASSGECVRVRNQQVYRQRRYRSPKWNSKLDLGRCRSRQTISLAMRCRLCQLRLSIEVRTLSSLSLSQMDLIIRRLVHGWPIKKMIWLTDVYQQWWPAANGSTSGAPTEAGFLKRIKKCSGLLILMVMKNPRPSASRLILANCS